MRHTPLRVIGAVGVAAALLVSCGAPGEPEALSGRVAADPDADLPSDDAGADGPEHRADDVGERTDTAASAPDDEADPGSRTVDAGPDGGSTDEEFVVDPTTEPLIDPADVHADELGVVPVLMYHQLRDDGGSDWDLTPEQFRAELVRLFDAGYVPIRAIDLVRGRIDVPPGLSPVVLTFDDSTRSQASLDEDGEIAAESSIGILIEVAAGYEHVEPVASMYLITDSLFGGTAAGPDVVRRLHELGMEIGNHSHTHPNLSTLNAEDVQRELATNVAEVRAIVPDAEVVTLSLPLGIHPEQHELALAGIAGGVAYRHEGVLLVGYEPAPSPFHAEFDPEAIPRIQTHADPEFQFGSAWWLEQLALGGSYRRFVSDGDPTTISFPAERASELRSELAHLANPYRSGAGRANE